MKRGFFTLDILLTQFLIRQVGVDSDSQHLSAMSDEVSKDKGFLPLRFSVINFSYMAMAAIGLIVYNTDEKLKINQYNNFY